MSGWSARCGLTRLRPKSKQGSGGSPSRSETLVEAGPFGAGVCLSGSNLQMFAVLSKKIEVHCHGAPIFVGCEEHTATSFDYGHWPGVWRCSHRL